MMTVQEVFDTPVVSELEQSILRIHRDIGHRSSEGSVKAIVELLDIRQSIVNSMFVMTEEYKRLLGEFNDALRNALTDMRLRTIKAYEAVADSGVTSGEIYAEGQCYLGYDYSPIHPVQTIRAKKIWAILNGTIDEHYNPRQIGMEYRCNDHYQPSLNHLLSLNEEEDNWNDELDREMTADMHLIFPIHDLHSHMKFSMFDLLWVRDFNTEITVDFDSETSNLPHKDDDLNWDKIDW